MTQPSLIAGFESINTHLFSLESNPTSLSRAAAPLDVVCAGKVPAVFSCHSTMSAEDSLEKIFRLLVARRQPLAMHVDQRHPDSADKLRKPSTPIEIGQRTIKNQAERHDGSMTNFMAIFYSECEANAALIGAGSRSGCTPHPFNMPLRKDKSVGHEQAKADSRQKRKVTQRLAA